MNFESALAIVDGSLSSTARLHSKQQRPRVDVTPPRSKRPDNRGSAERGMRRAKDDDFITPLKQHKTSSSSIGDESHSVGDYAPVRARRLQSRPPDFYQDYNEDDDDLETKLSDLMRACTKLG